MWQQKSGPENGAIHNRKRGHPPVDFVISAILKRLCVPTCFLRMRGATDGRKTAGLGMRAFGVCVCETRPGNLCDAVARGFLSPRQSESHKCGVIRGGALLATGYFLPAVWAELQIGTSWRFPHELEGGIFVSASSRARLVLGALGVSERIDVLPLSHHADWTHCTWNLAPGQLFAPQHA